MERWSLKVKTKLNAHDTAFGTTVTSGSAIDGFGGPAAVGPGSTYHLGMHDLLVFQRLQAFGIAFGNSPGTRGSSGWNSQMIWGLRAWQHRSKSPSEGLF